MDIFILFGSLLLLMLVGMPVTFSMGIAATFFLFVTDQFRLAALLPLQMVAGLEHYGLMAIPMFYFAGAVMTAGGLTNRLLEFARVLIGRVPGSLSKVNIAGSMFFAGVSGSCTADTSAIGSVLIPAMKKEGYSGAYAAAVTAASSTIGHIIPPSIVMILIGVMMELPIGQLFLAGAVPGLLLGLALMAISFWLSVARGYPRAERMATASEIAQATVRSLSALAMPVIVIGGILFGVVTVTETGVIAFLYALIVSMFYREMSLAELWELIVETSQGAGTLLILIAPASFFSWVVVTTGMGHDLVELITSITTNPHLVMLLVIVFLLIIGCALDTVGMIFIFVPVFFPLTQAVGIDPRHFAPVFVLCLGIALLTPPVGIILFMVTNMSKAPLTEVIREITPFFAAQLAVLGLVAYVPFLSTWLPGLMTN